MFYLAIDRSDLHGTLNLLGVFATPDQADGLFERFERNDRNQIVASQFLKQLSERACPQTSRVTKLYHEIQNESLERTRQQERYRNQKALPKHSSLSVNNMCSSLRHKIMSTSARNGVNARSNPGARRKMRRVFEYADLHRDGCLTTDQARRCLDEFNFHPDEQHFNLLLKRFPGPLDPETREPSIDYRQFIQHVFPDEETTNQSFLDQRLSESMDWNNYQPGNSTYGSVRNSAFGNYQQSNSYQRSSSRLPRSSSSMGLYGRRSQSPFVQNQLNMSGRINPNPILVAQSGAGAINGIQVSRPHTPSWAASMAANAGASWTNSPVANVSPVTNWSRSGSVPVLRPGTSNINSQRPITSQSKGISALPPPSSQSLKLSQTSERFSDRSPSSSSYHQSRPKPPSKRPGSKKALTARPSSKRPQSVRELYEQAQAEKKQKQQQRLHSSMRSSRNISRASMTSSARSRRQGSRPPSSLGLSRSRSSWLSHQPQS